MRCARYTVHLCQTESATGSSQSTRRSHQETEAGGRGIRSISRLSHPRCCLQSSSALRSRSVVRGVNLRPAHAEGSSGRLFYLHPSVDSSPARAHVSQILRSKRRQNKPHLLGASCGHDRMPGGFVPSKTTATVCLRTRQIAVSECRSFDRSVSSGLCGG